MNPPLRFERKGNTQSDFCWSYICIVLTGYPNKKYIFKRGPAFKQQQLVTDLSMKNNEEELI